MPSSSSSSNSAGTPADVNGLRVFVPNSNLAGFLQIHPGSTKFDCTAAIVSLALDILESKSSVIALKTFTREVVTLNQDVRELRDLPEFHIELKANEFLGSVRRSFPHIVITNANGMRTKNGRTTKRDCLGTFEPKSAAVIELNETLVDRMANANCVLVTRDSDAHAQHYHTLLFRLAITVAHELVHIYNLFLRRRGVNHTPPPRTYGGYRDQNAGESGRYWEYLVFGGFIDMRDTSSNPHNNMEAVAIRDSHRNVWRIKNVVIEGILSRDFGRWLKPGEPINDPEHPKNTFTQILTPYH